MLQKKKAARVIAQVTARPWVQSPVLQKKEKEKSKELKGRPPLDMGVKKGFSQEVSFKLKSEKES
jgi:hypothetical protein